MSVTTATGGWVNLPLEARQSRFITFTAPNARAKDFVIELINK